MIFGKKTAPQSCKDNVVIGVRTASSIIEEINKDKELAEKDIKSFCRDKAVELLHGHLIVNESLRFVRINDTLSILNFLASLDRG